MLLMFSARKLFLTLTLSGSVLSTMQSTAGLARLLSMPVTTVWTACRDLQYTQRARRHNIQYEKAAKVYMSECIGTHPVFSDLLLHFSGELNVSCSAERSSPCGRPSRDLSTLMAGCFGRSDALLLRKRTNKSTGTATRKYI